MKDLASHHLVSLVAIRDAVKLHLKTGLSLGPDETARLVQRLNTVVELIRDQDEQQRIDGLALMAAQLRARPRQPDDCAPYDPERPTAAILSFPHVAGDGVVAFPRRPSGGGRA